MRSLGRLRRGTLSRQFLKRKRGAQTFTHGPCFVLQGYLHGEKFSRHVPASEAQEVGAQVDNYKRFQQLTEEFVAVTDRMTQMYQSPPDSKKNSSRKKSPTSGSARSRPS